MRILRSAIIGLAVVMSPSSAMAHHSFSAEFDVGSPIDITGTVTKIEWTNPHAWVFLDTEGDTGEMESWAIELLGINSLIRSGMTPTTVTSGDRVNITGYRARNGSNKGNASSVKKAETGETLWASAREGRD